MHNTKLVDKKFQIELLLKKLNSIKKSIDANDGFYDLKHFIYVLNTGYDEKIPESSSAKDLENFLNSKKHSKN